MIQDKDFTLRLVRQLSTSLEKLLLGKPEESLMEKNLDFDVALRDIFKMDFKSLSEKSTNALKNMVEILEDRNHVDYFLLFGTLFYYHWKEDKTDGFKENAIMGYENYLQKSGVFALPIITRIAELKKV
jgi:hypothetical protein